MESAHPMVVHFPIALLLTAVSVDLAAVLFQRVTWHRIALWNLSVGVLGAGLAVLTGLRAEEVAKHTFEIHQVMELHKRLGFSTLILGIMAVVWRLVKRDRLTIRGRIATLLASLAMMGTLMWGAHLGGRLVYEFGVGGAFGK